MKNYLILSSVLLNSVVSNVFSHLGRQYKLLQVLLVVGALVGFSPRAAAQGKSPVPGLVADSTEMRVLREFYYATGGNTWNNRTNWLQGTTLTEVGTWAGVTVSNGDVTSLVSNNNNLQGSLPASLGLLLGLKQLEFSGALSLTGPIPIQLGQLRQLQTLVFSSTGISGAIPTEIGQLIQLTYLSFYNNRLSGRIPPALGNLSELTALYLGTNITRPPGHGNIFQGEIPPELGRLKNLTTLEISVTSIGGAIPPELGNLSNLISLELDGNQLKGPVPSTLLNLRNLTSLLLSNNQLTQIPRLQVKNPAGLRLAVHTNALDFGSLEPQFTAPGQHPFGSFPYSPQASPPGADTVAYFDGASLQLTCRMGGQHNNYQWEQLVGTTWTDIVGARDTTLLISKAGKATKGSYRARVTNSWVTGLTLYTGTVYAKMLPLPQDSTRLFLDKLVAQLDKSQVPTGLLNEFGVPLVPLDLFKGALTDSSLMNPDGFRFLYATVYSSWLGAGDNPLPSPLELNARLEAVTSAGKPIAVMVQHIDYASIRSDAFQVKLLSIQNNQLFDLPGRQQSPYQIKTVFAAAPATTYSATGDVTFIFPRKLDFDRSSAAEETLSIDFGDGRGYIDASWDQPVGAHYPTAGTWRVKVRVRYSTTAERRSQTFESHFDMHIDGSAAIAAALKESNSSSLTTTANDLNFYVPWTVNYGGAKVTIHYADGHTSLQNPLIIVEGYDKNGVAPEVQKRNYDLAEFLRDIHTGPGFDFGASLAHSMKAVGSNPKINSYDIVFIDFADGTDDILRNGLVLEEVLAQVEERKQGTAPNVIMGMSMGGLIARYTLAKMTKEGRDPHTRLLILQDSPQQGANIPLGIQALTLQMNFVLPIAVHGVYLRTTSLSPLLRQGIALLSEPATRQMLVHTATNGTDGFSPNTFLATVYHPMIAGDTDPGRLYTVVAASQGSQCGRGLFGPSSPMIQASGDVSFGFFGVRTGFTADVLVNALPKDSAKALVSYLGIKSHFYLFGEIIATYNIVDKSYWCPPGLLAWDGVAGSTEDIAAGGINDKSNTSILGILKFGKKIQVTEQFTFLPTPSALSIPITGQAVLYGSYANGVGTPGTSRLKSFIAQESYEYGTTSTIRYNLHHLAFTPRNTEWMYSMMEGLPLPNSYCTDICIDPTTLAIKGPETLCNITRYSSPLQQTKFTYLWKAIPRNLFTVSTGTEPTFETANTGAVGSGTISLTVNMGSCSTVYTKAVLVGATSTPQITDPIWGPLCGPDPVRASLTISNYDPTISYRFDVSYPLKLEGDIIRQNAGSTFFVTVTGTGSGFIRISAINTNSGGCGNAIGFLNFSIPRCKQASASTASADIYLDAAHAPLATPKPPLFDKLKAGLTVLSNPIIKGNLRFIITGTGTYKKADVFVIDFTGRIVTTSVASSLLNTTINVSHLTTGIYILVVKLDDLQLQQRFIKY